MELVRLSLHRYHHEVISDISPHVLVCLGAWTRGGEAVSDCIDSPLIPATTLEASRDLI